MLSQEMTSAQERKIRQTGCDVRFDNLTRQLYATDASIYQIEPLGVAFPHNARQASAVIRAARTALSVVRGITGKLSLTIVPYLL
jgi:FAD/FMN-containing dehydrogenase